MPNTDALVKAKETKEMKNSLMLSGSPMNLKQLLHIIQKTPAEHIYHRVGKGGGQFEYVTGTYIKKMLNYTFGWMWDFEVRDHGREKDMIWVLGRLTIKDKKGTPMIVKEQFGRADVKYYKDRTKGELDFGNDLKSAATDALKKCASEFGIASDVYGKGEFEEIKAKGYQTEAGDKEESQTNKASALMASDYDKQRIRTIAAELGMKKITGLDNLTKVEASRIYFGLMEKKANKK